MLGVLLLLAATLGGPAEEGALRGRVTFDDQQRPAVGATIRVIGTQSGAVTDDEGDFMVPGLAPGSYDVEVSFIGYRRERLSQIEIHPGVTTEIDVRLAPSPFNLDAVVVTGTLNRHLLKDAPVLTEVIGSRELSVIGSKNLAEILQSQTGIEVESGIGQTQNASLHGLNDNHVLVLIDGERVSGKVDGSIDLGSVPTAMVDRIEVVKGPLSSIYGSDALGGVINILTKTPLRSEATASATLGTLGRQDYHLSGSHVVADLFGTDLPLRLVGNVSHNRFGGVDYLEKDGFMEMPSSERFNANIKTVSVLSDRFTVEVKADHYRDQLQWLAGDIGITYLNDFARNQKLSLTGVGTYVISDRLSVKASAHKSQNDRRSWETTGAGFLTRDSYARELLQTYRVQGTAVPYDRSVLTWGVEYNEETMNSSRFSGGVRSVSNRVVYAEDEWDLGLGTVAVGGRFSDNSAFSAVFAPRVSVMVPITERTTFRASYGRGYREPSLLELYIDFDHSSVGYILKGDPTLKPEDSRGFTAGLQYNRDDLVWFRVTYFQNRLNNLIDYYSMQNSNVGSAAILSYRNVDRAITEGVDVDVDLALIPGTLATLSYNYVRAVDGFGHDLPFRTPQTIMAKLNGQIPFWSSSVDVRVRWYDRKPYNDDQVNRDIYSSGVAPQYLYVPSYAIVDLRLSARPIDRFECFAGVNNLFDETKYPFGQIKPRDLYLGINVTIQ